MSLDVILVHLGLAIMMFFIVNWLGKQSTSLGYIHLSVFARDDPAPAFNFTFRVLSPSFISCLFLLHCTPSIWNRSVQNIFFIVLYYFGFRLLFNVASERWRLLNWISLGPQIVVTVVLSVISYSYLIRERNVLFPNLETIGNQAWLAIAVFLYALFNRVRVVAPRTEQRKRAYVWHRYTKFDARYGSVVRKHTSNCKLEALIFAVMILEAFNRPKLYRIVEGMLFWTGYPRSFGIMQVKAAKNVSDLQSVDLGAAKIVSDHSEALAELKLDPAVNLLRKNMSPKLFADHLENRVIHQTLVKYNYSGDDARDVEDLHKVVLKEFYAHCEDSLLGDVLSDTHPKK